MQLLITVGQRHNGSWTVIHGPEVEPTKQVDAFRDSLGNVSHAEFQRLEVHRLVPGTHQYLKRFAPVTATANPVDAGDDQKKTKYRK